MPYNMQVMILKAQESEAFFKNKMYEKEKETENLIKQVKILERKWSEGFEVQQEMESALEDYENNTQWREEQQKTTNRRLQEFQK